MISIGILTYNSPLTLKNTLESYKVNGLLDYTDDIKCLIQPSNKSNEENKICEYYGIQTIIEKTNTMMAGGIKKLVEKSKYDYFLFLESDFRLYKNKDITNIVLNFGLNLLQQEDKFDVVRLRSLKNPGHPIHWNLQKQNGILYNENTELYLCTHYLENPHLTHPEYIKKISTNPIVYEIKSKNCVYTNNPNITSKKFYFDNIFPHIKDGSHLEPEIFSFWKQNSFKIAITSGLFTHARIDGHDGKSCYCCESKFGGRSDNINCVCCTVPYKSYEFDKSQICDTLNDKVDENYLNNIYNNLQFSYYSNK